MLQANEIQQRFDHLQQTIAQAEQASMSASDTPPQLKDCIQKIARESKQCGEAIKSNDQSRIIECVDSLEAMGDDLKRISRSDTHTPPQLETAVTQVHAELSDLKHKLH
jgi:Zn-dependent oligopeptidase